VLEREMNLNADRKRLWFQKLNDINDGIMIDSMPIPLPFIAKERI